MTEAEKKANPPRSYLTLALDAVITAGATVLTAYHSITGYAHSNFEKAGLFKKVEQDIADTIKKADPRSISNAIKSSGADEGMTYLGGIFGEMENKYWAGVKKVFEEKGAPTLATKWEKVLSTAQKTKTVLFTAGAAVGVGALAYWMSRRGKNNDIPVAMPGDTKYADRISEQRTDDKTIAR